MEEQRDLTTLEMLKLILESQNLYFKNMLEEYKNSQSNLFKKYISESKNNYLYQSPQTDLIDTAFREAKTQFGSLLKSAAGYNYKYVDLEEVIKATEKPLADHGLTLRQPLITENKEDYIFTMIKHDSGQWFGSKTLVRIEETNKSMHQDWGTAITYTRKYAAKSLLGLADEDNDGAR